MLEDLDLKHTLNQAIRAVLESLHRLDLDHVEILLALVVAAETVATTSLLVVLAFIHELVDSLLNIVVSSYAEVVQDVDDLAGIHVGHRDRAILGANYQVASRVRGDGLSKLLITSFEVRLQLLGFPGCGV